MLNQPEHPSGEANAGLAALTEVVLETEDIRATHRDLLVHGVPFRIEPCLFTSDGSRDLMAADFRDPDDHLESITRWVAKPTR
jgi:hypothetical protein